MAHKKKAIAGLMALSLGLTACGNSDSTSEDAMSESTTTTHHTGTSMPVALAAVKTAPDLRTNVDILLGEHIVLASKATGAALLGQTDEYNAYSKALNDNGTDLGSIIGAAYGTAAQTQFNGIWSAHNGFFVDYTTGVATKDKAKQDKAVADLTGTYVPQFSKFISDATGLPLPTVTTLTTDHVVQTKAIVDAQAAKNYTEAYKALNGAYAHMQMIGDPVSQAVATKFADKFPGNAASKATDLQVTLNQGLQAHMYLASSATGAALAGRNDEFAAAGAALNTNGTDLGAAIGSVFGNDARNQFNSIWSAHNGFFVDYTTGVATKDKAKQDKAVADLTGTYVPQFSKFLADATGLPLDTVTNLVTMHVTMTKGVVDAQAAKTWAEVATNDRSSAHHMQALANPLASAIAAKFPAQFPG